MGGEVRGTRCEVREERKLTDVARPDEADVADCRVREGRHCRLFLVYRVNSEVVMAPIWGNLLLGSVLAVLWEEGEGRRAAK